MRGRPGFVTCLIGSLWGLVVGPGTPGRPGSAGLAMGSGGLTMCLPRGKSDAPMAMTRLCRRSTERLPSSSCRNPSDLRVSFVPIRFTPSTGPPRLGSHTKSFGRASAILMSRGGTEGFCCRSAPSFGSIPGSREHLNEPEPEPEHGMDRIEVVRSCVDMRRPPSHNWQTSSASRCRRATLELGACNGDIFPKLGDVRTHASIDTRVPGAGAWGPRGAKMKRAGLLPVSKTPLLSSMQS